MGRSRLISAAVAFMAMVAVPAAASDGAWDPFAAREGDIVIGADSAPVTIVEYASLSCPFCADFHNRVLPESIAPIVDDGRARLVYRHMPLDGQALGAAMVVDCLPSERRPGAIASLFANRDWISADDPVAAAATTAAAPEELDGVLTCMGDAEQATRTISASLEAIANGVEATPTFFIGDDVVVGSDGSGEALTDAVERTVSKEFAR